MSAISRQQLTQWQTKPQYLVVDALLDCWIAGLLDCWIAGLLDWAVIITAWIVMSMTESKLITIIGIFFIAGRLHALGGILHDAAHAEYRQKTTLWYLVEVLSGWAISSTTEAMRYHHIRHHRYVGTLNDPYLPRKFMGNVLPTLCMYARGVLLPFWWTIRPFVGLVALLLPRYQPAYARLFLQDRSQQNLANNSEIIQCAKADLLQLVAHTLVITIVLIWQLPFLTTFLIPVHIAGILNARRLALEHPPITKGELFDKPVPAHRQDEFTASSETAWWQQWFLLPHNLGLHAEHHRYPSVAYQHLPRVRALMASTNCASDERELI